ncbi:MAG: hypothetical protein IT334_07055 [Thermomicrobiales bacterium]|nr:hypothetical protein [Thermomicrobiales bacterium]
MTINDTQFDPGRYLRKVNGSDYLEVKWRLLWLRTEHPDATIATEMISHDGQMALFRATVSIPGGGSATGWGSEHYNDFRDYIEKAETKALGRALSALGFGTQFCPDFDFTGTSNRIVDAPIDLQARRDEVREQASAPIAAQEVLATDKQIRYLTSMARELGISEPDLQAEANDLYGREITQLTRRDVSQFIDRLQARKSERASHISA